MIDATYGHLAAGSEQGARDRLDAWNVCATCVPLTESSE
jgi:hypothetical protein